MTCNYCIIDTYNGDVIADGFLSQEEGAAVVYHIEEAKRRLNKEKWTDSNYDRFNIIPNTPAVFDYIFAGNKWNPSVFLERVADNKVEEIFKE